MNKTECISNIAEKTGVTKKDTAAVIEAFIAEITDTLAKGDSVQFVGFGTFSVRDRAARTGVNPQTGAKIKIAATRVPAFKAGKTLKAAIAATGKKKGKKK